jgi:hypothetical protein
MRFTIRRLMVATAIVGVSLAVFVTLRAREKFRKRALLETRSGFLTRRRISQIIETGILTTNETSFAKRIDYGPMFDGMRDIRAKLALFREIESRIRESQPHLKLRDEAATQFVLLRRRLDYHAVMRQKYERAARRPWLRVEPDPPEPQ